MTEEELFIVFFSYLSGDRVVNGLDFSEYSFFEYLKTNIRFLDDKRCACSHKPNSYLFVKSPTLMTLTVERRNMIMNKFMRR